MRYDAFISYRHGGLDGQVAERLHHLLETFRIPRPIAKKIGKKSLSRIFRDKEELPTSADLSSNIQAALEESEFLLLICSPRTAESRWVLQEVERFIALRGRERVITLLIDGEPEAVFPKQLRFHEVDGQLVEVEPLAADIRAPSERESLKKLKGEITRILAPLLGVRYDDLRQRHRERRVKRLAAAGAVAAALVVAFSVYAFSQYLRIQQQMQLKLESQSYVLAEYSGQVLRQGDVPTAALLALEGLPQNLQSPERPYVPAAEQALAQALGVYNYDTGFTWHRALQLEGEVGEVWLSPDETLLAVGDDTGGTVIIDTATGRQVAHMGEIWWGSSKRFGFLANGLLVQLTGDGLLALDARTQETQWQLPLAEMLTVAPGGAFFATLHTSDDDQSVVRQYDATGALLQETTLEDHRVSASGFGEADYNCFEMSADGQYVAVRTIGGALLLIKPGTHPVVLETGMDQMVCAFGNNTMAYTCSSYNDTGEIEPLNLKQVDLRTGFTQQVHASAARRLPFTLLPEGTLCYAADNRILYRGAAGNESVLATFDTTVVSFSVCADTLLAGCASGSYYFHSLSAGSSTAFSSDTVCRLTALGRQVAVCADGLSGNIRLLRQNTRQPQASYGGVAGYGNVRANGAGTRVLACVRGTVQLADMDTGALLRTFETNPELYYSDEAFFSPQAENIVISHAGGLDVYDPTGATLLFHTDRYHTILGHTAQWQQDDRLMILDLDTAALAEEIALAPDTPTAWALGGTLFLDETGMDYRVINRRSGAEYSLGDRYIMAWQQRGEDFLLCIASLWEDTIEVYDTAAGRVVFSLPAGGAQNAWFTADGAALVLAQGTGHATAYTLATGVPLADLGQAGALLTDMLTLPGGDIITSYQTAAGEETFAVRRQPGTLAALAQAERFVAVAGPGSLLVHNPAGDTLSRIPLVTAEQLVQLAHSLLDGQTLTAAQREKYHIPTA